jgi:cytochrome c
MLSTFVATVILAQPAVPAERNITVFRSVLDQNARMLTIAFNKNLWIAYDTQTCSLYKAWTGGVKFDGAVYTTVHGPQPTSIGDPYILNQDMETWFLSEPNATVPLKTRYLGYRFIGRDQVRINYQFKTEAGQIINVTETPEALHPNTTHVGLNRTFAVSGLHAEQKLSLIWREPKTGNILDKASNGITYPGFEIDPSVKLNQRLVQLGNGAARFGVLYEISGTPGGIQQAPDDDGDLNPQPTPPQAQDVAKERVPGLSLRLYYTGIDMNQIPELISGQTPNYSVVIPQVKLGDKDWGGFEDNFLAHITGFITVDQAGTYEFQLGSDDGGRLFIGDNLIVNHDGLHGKSFKAGKTELNAGENSIRIEYFENGGNAELELRWKKPGDDAFTTVPTSALVTPAGEVRVTAPGKKGVMGIDNFRPGDRRPLEGVHPAYDLTQARPDDFAPRVGGIAFLPNNDMLICTWDAVGGVYQIKNWDKSPAQMSVKQIASGLAEPLGLKVVDGRIYVLQKQELTELIDHNRDGVIDEYRCVANGWGVTANFHEFAFGLEYLNGKFYGNLATAIDPGGRSTQPQNIDRGRTVEIDPRTGEFKFIIAGLRTPNGIGFGALGKLYISDNQGDWLPSSKIMVVKPGAFYGNRSVEPAAKADTPEDPPVVWLPQNEIGNSPSQIAPLNHGPFKGQMVHGDVTHGGLKRVYVEEVNGILQGTVFRFTQGLEAGINRVVVAPDGSFIVGGIGSSGNWGQTGKQSYGTQRLQFNNRSVFEMLSASPRKNGIEVRFTQPLHKEVGDSPTYFTVKQYKYVPTAEYGGPKIDEETLEVKAVTVTPNRWNAFLHIEGLKPGHVVYIQCHPSLQSDQNEFLWSTEAWMTNNVIPKTEGPKLVRQVKPPVEPARSNELTSSMTNFAGWNRDTIPGGWSLQGGVLAFTPGVEGGDLRTARTYKNFDLTFEWKVAPGANSGVMIHAQLREGFAPWQTGPEYQILDNTKHADGRNPVTSASSMYALYRPDYDYTRPVGEWNVGRIVSRNGVIEHYLNHKLMVKVDMNSREFLAQVAASKFNGMPEFGLFREGHIVFQDHGDPVSYRRIAIRELP